MQGMQGMKGHGIHWGCCWMPIFGHLAYAWGVLSLIFAFVAGADGVFWGMGAAGWMWSGLVAGVLAVSGSKKRMGSCRGCSNCGSATCGGCGTSGGGKCC